MPRYAGSLVSCGDNDTYDILLVANESFVTAWSSKGRFNELLCRCTDFVARLNNIVRSLSLPQTLCR